MIITISGKAGSGKSTVAKMLAKKLSLKHYSSGDLMRNIAKEHGITLAELQKKAEKEPWVDKELDERQKNLGDKEDNFIIDGRLSWHFIPKSVKVYLDVSDDIAVKRIWGDKESRKNEGFENQKDLARKLKERRDSEIKRYKKYYGINHHDKKNYDLIIDTSEITAEEVADQIKRFLKNR